MTSPSELPRSERLRRAKELHDEAEKLLAEYREIETQAQIKLAAATAKFNEAKAMMPLPLFDDC